MTFKKGQSGNPAGREKSRKIPPEILAQAKQLDDPSQLVLFWDLYLLKNPQTISEIERFCVKCRDSYLPKLKSIETKVTQDNTITITWQASDKQAIPEHEMKVIEHNDIVNTDNTPTGDKSLLSSKNNSLADAMTWLDS